MTKKGSFLWWTSISIVLFLVIIERFFESFVLSSIVAATFYFYGRKPRNGPRRNMPDEHPDDEFTRSLSILGIEEPFSMNDLRAARKKLAKKYHPDSGTDKNQLKMSEVNEAYELLKPYASVD